MENIKCFFSATKRRRLLDDILLSHNYLFTSDLIVLDIGGRDRGLFKKPKNIVKKWIFADIEAKHKPDIILDVCDMKEIPVESIDIILATELFEHVRKPEEGLRECFKVLKDDGVLIISAPFLYRIHGDPFDFQRWTDEKWEYELKSVGFKVQKLIIMGRYFSVMVDNFIIFVLSLPRILRYILYPFIPLALMLTLFDQCKCIKDNKILGSFHGGYFISAKK